MRPWDRHIIELTAALPAIAMLSGCTPVQSSRVRAFYEPPPHVRSERGSLLRSEPFTRKIPAGSRAWKILYTTTRGDGSAALASALVLVSRQPHEGPRHLVAWLHGSSGIEQACAPSLLRQPYMDIPAIDKALEEGWVIVATDYTGLGTQGPHPFLIGQGEARSALDSIRAARELDALWLDDETAIWGVSQGGHAALWAGILASSYARDVKLVGIAAAAPATDLVPLVDAGQNTLAGRIISSMIVFAYSERFPDVRIADYISPDREPRVHGMASRCMAFPQILLSAGQSFFTHESIFRVSPASGALARRLEENTPRGRIEAPLFIAQGDEDDLVLPGIQKGFVQARCRAGQPLEYKVYAGRGHVSLLEPGSPYNADLVSWTRARFDGVLPPSVDCAGTALKQS